MRATYRSVIAGLLLALSGCDKVYHLVPIGVESGATRFENSSVVIERSGLEISVSGGHVQSPYTSKVRAHILTVRVAVNCDTVFTWNMNKPFLVSNSNKIFASGVNVTKQDPSTGKRRETVYSKHGATDSVLAAAHTMGSGEQVWLLGFGAEDGGMKYLEFPITLHLGSIYVREDTIRLNDIPFGAVLGPQK